MKPVAGSAVPRTRIDSAQFTDMSDGPRTAKRFARPSGTRQPILTLPDMMMYDQLSGVALGEEDLPAASLEGFQFAG